MAPLTQTIYPLCLQCDCWSPERSHLLSCSLFRKAANIRDRNVLPFDSFLFVSKHDIPEHFRPGTILRWRLATLKDKTPRWKLNNVIHAVAGKWSKDCPDLYIRETKQPLHRCISQHRRAITSGQDLAVHLHLQEKGYSCQDSNIHILGMESRWYERGVNEAIYVHSGLLINRGGALRILHFFFCFRTEEAIFKITKLALPQDCLDEWQLSQTCFFWSYILFNNTT